MAKPGKKVTMRQVAELAGVSTMTVSKALADKPGISRKTKDLVIAAAKELNYLPNALAASFRTKRTNTIGVVMAEHLLDVFPPVFRGIEAAAAAHGYSTVLGNTAHASERDIIHMLASNLVDGIIVNSPLRFGPEERELLDAAGIPYVLTMRTHPDDQVTTVQNNNYAGAYAMVEHLVKGGARRFLFLALEDRLTCGGERLRGWTDALTAHGINPKSQRVVTTPPGIESGRQAIRAQLEKERTWDAVVCGSDTQAIGAIEELVARGIAIPGEVKVTGYDGMPMSRHLRIPLTTIQQALYEIGKTSMQLLNDRIADPSLPAQQIQITGKLVVRESA